MANINISRLNKYNTNSFMVHSADPKLSVEHIKFWLEVFGESGEEFSILVRDETSYKKLVKEFPSLQICYANTPVDVETVVNKQLDLKIIFFTSNMAKNIHLLRFNHLKHIFIGTKNSDFLSHLNKSYRAYDEFWCGGEYVIERFKKEVDNLGHLEFKIVGKPQLKEIIEKPQLVNFFGTKNQPEGVNLILIDNSNELLLEQIYFATLMLNQKMYLYLERSKESIRNNLMNVAKSHNFTKNIQLFDNKDLINEFTQRSTCIITDLKNLTPYSLQYKLPVIVYIEKESDKYLIDEDLLRESLYYFSNKHELMDVLKEIKNDILKIKREEVLDKFFNQEAIIKNSFLKALADSL